MDPQGPRPRDVGRVEDMPVNATCHQHTLAGSGVMPKPSKIPQSEGRILMFIHSHISLRNGSAHLQKTTLFLFLNSWGVSDSLPGLGNILEGFGPLVLFFDFATQYADKVST